MQLTVLPAVEDLQTDEATRARWIDYSAYDAKATWQLCQALRKELKVGFYTSVMFLILLAAGAHTWQQCFDANNWSRLMLCLRCASVVRSIVACNTQQQWQVCVTFYLKLYRCFNVCAKCLC